MLFVSGPGVTATYVMTWERTSSFIFQDVVSNGQTIAEMEPMAKRARKGFVFLPMDRPPDVTHAVEMSMGLEEFISRFFTDGAPLIEGATYISCLVTMYAHYGIGSVFKARRGDIGPAFLVQFPKEEEPLDNLAELCMAFNPHSDLIPVNAVECRVMINHRVDLIFKKSPLFLAAFIINWPMIRHINKPSVSWMRFSQGDPPEDPEILYSTEEVSGMRQIIKNLILERDVLMGPCPKPIRLSPYLPADHYERVVAILQDRRALFAALYESSKTDPPLRRFVGHGPITDRLLYYLHAGRTLY